MKLFPLIALAAIVFMFGLDAAPPGQATQGRAYREGGRIKYEPKVYNQRPFYYEGDLLYERDGRPYRDRSGRIQTERSYARYPYKYPSANYELESERLDRQSYDRQKSYERQ